MADVKRPTRLGRGLSSLMAQPVSIVPPAITPLHPAAAVANAAPAVSSGVERAGEVPGAWAEAGAGLPLAEASGPASVVAEAGAMAGATAGAMGHIERRGGEEVATVQPLGGGQVGERGGRLSAQESAEASGLVSGAGETGGTAGGSAAGVERGVVVAESGPESEVDRLVYLEVGRIEPNPDQPRKRFDEAALQGLAQSIRSEGVMQPVIVRPKGSGYELVAGERRWRAAGLAGLERLPAVVRRLDDRQMAEWSLVENLQREDLNPIERAEAFQRLARQFELSHEQIAERVGVERSTITNALRLLALPEEVRELVAVGTLSAGHARAIAGLGDAQRQRAVAQRVVSQSWSVRRLEAELKRGGDGAGQASGQGVAGEAAGESEQARPGSERRQAVGAHLADLERQLGEQLGTRVQLRAGRRKGTGWLTIEFFSAEHFEELMHRLDVKVSG